LSINGSSGVAGQSGNGVDQNPEAGDDLHDGAVGPRGGQLVLGVRHLDVGLAEADHGRAGFGEPGHRRAKHPQPAQRRVLAHHGPDRDPPRQPLDVRLTQRRLLRIGDGQPEHRPCRSDLLDRHTECLGRGAQAVGRAARPQEDVAGEAEQAPAALGVDHVLGGEPEAVQVFDQAGPPARVGDPCGFQGVEIDHLHKCVRGAVAIRVDSRAGN
jgi:hypothetical protein